MHGAHVCEQVSTPAPGTYGAILDTFRHRVNTDGWYLSFFRDEPQRIEEGAEVDLGELRSAITSNGKGWMELLASGLDGEADVVEHGDCWNFHSPAGFRLAQVVQHGTVHRSQICTALTSFGVEPPESSSGPSVKPAAARGRSTCDVSGPSRDIRVGHIMRA